MVEDQPAPKPMRNDVNRPSEEVLVLRHHRLELGSHRQFFEWSRYGIWPFFMRIGARVVGEWKVVYPDGSPAPTDHEDGWRLARYAGMDHWHDTRGGTVLGGNGPLQERFPEGGRRRNQYVLSRDEVYFLTGEMASGGPFYMPGLVEDYELIEDDEPLPEDAPRAVRLDVPHPGEEMVAFRHFTIEKGSFERFDELSRSAVWPYLEKIGVRPIGQWRRLYPEPPVGNLEENSDYDEAVQLIRYASYEHWEATRSPADLGGDGPDYDAMQEALRERGSLTRETSARFMQGYMFPNPPLYAPPLKERYRRV